MLRHRRLSPSGSTTRKKMIRTPNRISRRLGIMLAKSACEKISPPKDSRNQRVTIGNKVTKMAPKIEQRIERDGDLKLLVISYSQIIGIKNARNTGIKGRDRECCELIAEDVDADDFCGHVLIAHCDEGPADTAARQVCGSDDRQHGKRHQKQVELRLSLELGSKEA